MLLHFLLPLRIFAPLTLRIVGAVLILAGVILARWGARTMRRAGTNIRPDRPATVIVTGGPFRFSRNPLYLSLTLVYIGIAFMINGLWLLLLLVPLLIVVQRGVIRREERYLEAKFGAAYQNYKASVRRWF